MDDVIKVLSGALVLANVIGLCVGLWLLKWKDQQAKDTKETLEAKDRLLATLRDEQKSDRGEIAALTRRVEIAERDLMVAAREGFRRERYISQCEAILRLHKLSLPEEE